MSENLLYDKMSVEEATSMVSSCKSICKDKIDLARQHYISLSREQRARKVYNIILNANKIISNIMLDYKGNMIYNDIYYSKTLYEIGPVCYGPWLLYNHWPEYDNVHVVVRQTLDPELTQDELDIHLELRHLEEPDSSKEHILEIWRGEYVHPSMCLKLFLFKT